MATEHDIKSSLKRPTVFVSETKTSSKDAALTQESLANRGGLTLNTKTAVSGNGLRHSWESCYYCPRENFKEISEFVK